MTKKEKIFTPGNIILGVIILVLVGSLLFDFFRVTNKQTTQTKICPTSIENLVITNILYTQNGEALDPDKAIKDDVLEGADYKITALMRNLGEKNVTISQLALTEKHLGDYEVVRIEPVNVEPRTLKKFEATLDSGSYHKIDLYTDDPCVGNTVWHDQVGHQPIEQEAETNQQTEIT